MFLELLVLTTGKQKLNLIDLILILGAGLNFFFLSGSHVAYWEQSQFQEEKKIPIMQGNFV